MTQQGPNPIELYEGAVQQMLPVLAGVRADQLSASTPCTEWTVQNLITHNIKVADYIHGTIRGNNTTKVPHPGRRHSHRIRLLPGPALQE